MCNTDNTNRSKFYRPQSANKCFQTYQNDKIDSKTLSCKFLHTAKRVCIMNEHRVLYRLFSKICCAICG
jgi:hypothetical protein